MRNTRGFTLVELTITLAVVAVVSAGAVVSMREVLHKDAVGAEDLRARLRLGRSVADGRLGLDVVAIGNASAGGGPSRSMYTSINPSLKLTLSNPSGVTLTVTVHPATHSGTAPELANMKAVAQQLYPLGNYQQEDQRRLYLLIKNANIGGLRSELGASHVTVETLEPLSATGSAETYKYTHVDGYLVTDVDGTIVGPPEAQRIKMFSDTNTNGILDGDETVATAAVTGDATPTIGEVTP